MGTIEKRIIDKVTTMGRLDMMDNGITKPSEKEFLEAIDNALNDFNSILPVTSKKLNQFDTDSKLKPLLTTLCYGVLAHIYSMIIADISANRIDVMIDEFQISSKLNEYQMLYQDYQNKFNTELQQKKPNLLPTFVKGHRQTSTSLGVGFFRGSSVWGNRYINSGKGGRA